MRADDRPAESRLLTCAPTYLPTVLLTHSTPCPCTQAEDLPRLAGPSDATTRLQPDFDEATGQVYLYCSVEEDEDEQSTTSIYLLEYLDALLPTPQ